MRRIVLLYVVMLIFVSVAAQTKTTFINEHFDDSYLPTGWNVMGDGYNNWTVYNSNQAGGQANELIFMWYPMFEGTSRMVMPSVDLTGVSSVMISFKYYLDNNSGGSTIGIATSSDGGITWNDAWSQTHDSDVQSSINELVSTSDMGKDDVLFCLYFTGNSYNIFDYFFDDIEIYSVENTDLSLQSIDMTPTLIAGDRSVSCTVANKGLDEIYKITMTYQFSGAEMIEETFELALLPSDSTQLFFSQPTNLYPGTYSLSVNIEAVNDIEDDDPLNNTLTKNIDIIRAGVQRIPMIEHFSSSTCNPCVNVNTQMQYIIDNNPGKFTYTKYPMNWPGVGDPYFTEECASRSLYYTILGVPQLTLNGELMEPSMPISQIQLDNQYNIPAYAEIKGSFNIAGNILTAKIDFMSIEDLSANAFVTVNEKETHDNAMSNGETDFHHIFMKFLTDENGDDINISGGEYQHMELSYDLSSTNIEEIDDLEVAAWIQYDNHRIENSRFLYEYSNIHPYPVKNLVFTKTAYDTFKAQWDSPEENNAISYNIYLGGDLIANTTELEYDINVHEGIHVLAVEAVYENDMKSVKIFRIYDPTDSVDEYTDNEDNNPTFDIYPNPNKGCFNINLPDTYCDVTIVNALGQIMHHCIARGSSTFNVEYLNNGIYIVIIKSDASVSSMKFVKET